MLQAIISNKAGRSFQSNDMYWRDIFSASEDSLTSTVFGSLLYLPRDLFWRILGNSIYNCNIPFNESKIFQIEFWPRWDAINTSNLNYIEPDVFIRTEHYDIIIEAKRHDFDQQNENQWRNEIKGYLNQYGHENRSVYMIAVGGIKKELKEEIHIDGYVIDVYKVRWYRILNEVKSFLSDYEVKLEYYDPTYLILKDIISGFQLHGYITCEWFESIEFFGNNDIRSSSLKTIKSHHISK